MIKGIITTKQSLALKGYIPSEKKEFTIIPAGHLKEKGKIVVGDYFIGEIIDEQRVNIISIEPRINCFIRPCVANVKRVIVLSCYKNPEFTRLNLDKLLAVYDFYNAEPIVFFNKIDLLTHTELEDLNCIAKEYKSLGFNVVICSARTKNGIDAAFDIIFSPGVTVLAGESGTGKTTLINAIAGTEMITNEISHKTLRGRQTTIAVNLIRIAENSFIGDSPGFSEIDPALFMTAENFRDSYRGLKSDECKFDNCVHINEPGCAVRENFEDPLAIGYGRYNSYKAIMENLIAIPQWQNKKMKKI